MDDKQKEYLVNQRDIHGLSEWCCSPPSGCKIVRPQQQLTQTLGVHTPCSAAPVFLALQRVEENRQAFEVRGQGLGAQPPLTLLQGSTFSLA
jgi:hypothetical protein